VNRALHVLAVALITAGAVVLADVATTLAWREPLSSIYGAIQQDHLRGQLSDLERGFPSAADLRSARKARGVRARVDVLAHEFARQVNDGQAIGRVIIPSIDLDVVAVQGTDTADLQKGPGHYVGTPFPGEGGTTAFAGHRTTYLAPFRHLDSLRRGDEVDLEMPYGNLTYVVSRTRVVDPSDVGILHRTAHERLVLTACNPLYSASQRIVAFARLRRVSLFALGTQRWRDP
jgi:sortase A